MKIRHLFPIFVLLFLVACTPVTPSTSEEVISQPVSDPQGQEGMGPAPSMKNSDDGVVSAPEVEDQGEVEQAEEAKSLAAWMQTSVLVVKWNGKTHRNEIIPLETASLTSPPGIQPVSVGEEFIYSYSPGGQTLAVVTPRANDMLDSWLVMVDVPTWRVRETSIKFSKWVDSVVFSPDGSRLLILQWPQVNGNEAAKAVTLTLIDVKSETILAETDFPYRLRNTTFTQDGRGILFYGISLEAEAASGIVEPEVILMDANNFSVLWQAPLTGVKEGGTTVVEGDDYIHDFLYPGVGATNDGRYLYIVHAAENKLTTVDVQKQQVRTVEIAPKLSWIEQLLAWTAGTAHAKLGNGNYKEIAFSPDDSRIYVVGIADESFKDDKGEYQYTSVPLGLQVIDSSTGTEIAHVEYSSSSILGLSADGTRLYLRGTHGEEHVIVVDTVTLKMVDEFNGYALSPAQTFDGASIVVSSRTTSNWKTAMTILNPQTLETISKWDEPTRAYFLKSPTLFWTQKSETNAQDETTAGIPKTCPVTLPSQPQFAPPAPYPKVAPYAGTFWYGTENLWTSLPIDGKWAQLAYGEKVFWWRNGLVGSEELQPALSISARQLDGDLSVVEFGPPATNAYHPDFDWAMLMGIQLPNSGCWEITGHYREHDLSFVVWVGN